MNSKLAGLVVGVVAVGVILAAQDWDAAGANDRSGPAARPVLLAQAELPETVPAAIEAPPPQADDDVPVIDPQTEEPSTKRTVRGRRGGKTRSERVSPTTVVHLHCECGSVEETRRKLDEVQKELEKAQREAKAAAEARDAALEQVAAADKRRDELAQSLKNLQKSLQAAEAERDIARRDAEAAARSRDEALRTAEYTKKEHADAVAAAEKASRQAAQAAKERDQARQQAQAAQRERDAAQQIAREMQQQRLAAYDEAKAASADAVKTKQALAVAQRQAEERRKLVDELRSAERQWSELAVQLASAVGINEPLAGEDTRWNAQAESTRAWMDRVRERYAKLIAQTTKSGAGDLTGANFFYIEGLRHLREKNYHTAIKNFSLAIDANPEDARYYYLRGLARHLAADGNDAEAERDARRGAELEKNHAPNSRFVDEALERFQGASRLWVERFRR